MSHTLRQARHTPTRCARVGLSTQRRGKILMTTLDEQPACEYCGVELHDEEIVISLDVANMLLCEMCI